MQRDPLGYAAGLNLYAYAGGDPVNARDPSGLTTMCIGGSLFRIEPKPTNMLDDNSLALLKVETSRDQTPCYELPAAVGATSQPLSTGKFFRVSPPSICAAQNVSYLWRLR
jgi:uncharacterized protein RhaS with RHS repeats